MLNTASLSTLPQSTNELYAQMLFVALQRLGLDAHSYLDDPERARSASKALAVLWLAIELASCEEPGQLREGRFERSRDLSSLKQLQPLAKGLEPAAREQLVALNSSGLLDVDPEQWQRLVPDRGTDVMSTLALAWLAEAAVLGDELVVWLSDGAVLRRVIDALAFLLEETLEGGPAMEAAPVPLSRSVVGENERNALLDVWRAENNPALSSAIIPKPGKRPSARPQPAKKSARHSDDWSGRRIMVFAAISVAVLLLLGLWLSH